MKEIPITHNEANQRLDRFLLKYFNNASRSTIYTLLRKRKIKVNKKAQKANYFLQNNDIVEVFVSDEWIEKLITRRPVVSGQISGLAIVYEDEDILVVNKPAGLLTHPDKTEYRNTLSTKVQLYLQHLCTRTFRPASVQRLDKNTSGLILFCKNYESLKAYNELMRKKLIKKYYHCIVHGVVHGKSEIKGFLVKDEQKNQVKLSSENIDKKGKFCHTQYTVLKTKPRYSLLEVTLLTGRSHQIRASLALVGHPLIGDTKYGGRKTKGITTQLLHAYKLDCDGKIFEKHSEEIDIVWETL